MLWLRLSLAARFQICQHVNALTLRFLPLYKPAIDLTKIGPAGSPLSGAQPVGSFSQLVQDKGALVF